MRAPLWPEWYRFKISAQVFWWFILNVDMIFDKHSGEWGICFTFKRLLFFLIESPYFDWERYQGFW